jgi:hypothetical protein
LVDSRNDKTFYVGKGVGNRVFNHENEADKIKELIKEENHIELKALSPEDKKSFIAEKIKEEYKKCQKIKDIQDSQNEVKYVIHRHIPFCTSGEGKGKFDQKTAHKIAFEIEASLIDVYGLENLTNSQDGHGSNQRGSQLAIDLNRDLSREPIEEFSERVMAICINNSHGTRNSIYESVRQAWTCSEKSARECEFVLAERFGICVGVFKPTRWYRHEKETNRMAFEGEEVENSPYLNKRIPERKKGAMLPFRYFSAGKVN